ncbi:MAG: PBECR4 domain-containing protein [Candidatus Onthovivens sp.]|nr:PBECR4 domain-containing protein [Mollicutes bacterium]MCI6357223.1 PBECR4 domain-containing protein [Erysipelotrichaceae bacterium]MDY2725113.1 PBECR4 domain-containing protein [Candidatus Onthovivens sp.]MDY3994861.1 PBECR4 domain-containing protein [Candidatus Onthovivens sp.]MDY5645610.1 PBECR4 domain-containing protein [Candidatus Onthovivens sp.]
MANQFKENVKSQLIVAAQSYFFLLNKNVLLKSEQFKNRKIYRLAFTKSNFLHLSGVLTALEPTAFFEKCLSGQIKCDDFSYNEYKNKNTIKSKMKNLVHIDLLFKCKVFVQEDFVKNCVICKIATSDGKYTLGFTGSKGKLYPNTLLNNNHLDEAKVILKITPIIEEL